MGVGGGSEKKTSGIIMEWVRVEVIIRMSKKDTGSKLHFTLGYYYHQAARSIVGMTDWRTTSGYWRYPSVDDTLESVGIWTIK